MDIEPEKIDHIGEQIGKLKKLTCKVYSECSNMFGEESPITAGIGDANCQIDEAIGEFNNYVDELNKVIKARNKKYLEEHTNEAV